MLMNSEHLKFPSASMFSEPWVCEDVVSFYSSNFLHSLKKNFSVFPDS
jgi:hypothetical protein